MQQLDPSFFSPLRRGIVISAPPPLISDPSELAEFNRFVARVDELEVNSNARRMPFLYKNDLSAAHQFILSDGAGLPDCAEIFQRENDRHVCLLNHPLAYLLPEHRPVFREQCKYAELALLNIESFAGRDPTDPTVWTTVSAIGRFEVRPVSAVSPQGRRVPVITPVPGSGPAPWLGTSSRAPPPAPIRQGPESPREEKVMDLQPMKLNLTPAIREAVSRAIKDRKRQSGRGKKARSFDCFVNGQRAYFVRFHFFADAHSPEPLLCRFLLNQKKRTRDPALNVSLPRPPVFDMLTVPSPSNKRKSLSFDNRRLSDGQQGDPVTFAAPPGALQGSALAADWDYRLPPSRFRGTSEGARSHSSSFASSCSQSSSCFTSRSQPSASPEEPSSPTPSQKRVMTTEHWQSPLTNVATVMEPASDTPDPDLFKDTLLTAPNFMFPEDPAAPNWVTDQDPLQAPASGLPYASPSCAPSPAATARDRHQHSPNPFACETSIRPAGSSLDGRCPIDSISASHWLRNQQEPPMMTRPRSSAQSNTLQRVAPVDLCYATDSVGTPSALVFTNMGRSHSVESTFQYTFSMPAYSRASAARAASQPLAGPAPLPTWSPHLTVAPSPSVDCDLDEFSLLPDVDPHSSSLRIVLDDPAPVPLDPGRLSGPTPSPSPPLTDAPVDHLMDPAHQTAAVPITFLGHSQAVSGSLAGGLWLGGGVWNGQGPSTSVSSEDCALAPPTFSTGSSWDTSASTGNNQQWR